jgi:hypothetical protein
MKIEGTPEELKSFMGKNIDNGLSTEVIVKDHGCINQFSNTDSALKVINEIRKQEHNCHCTLVFEKGGR